MRSGHAVRGSYVPGQVLIHPVSIESATTVTREFSPLTHDTLTVAFALADGAVAGSNGVELFVELLDENDRSVVLIHPTKVGENRWSQQTVDLSSYVGQRVTLRLEVDALGKTGYDWLEIQLTMTTNG